MSNELMLSEAMDGARVAEEHAAVDKAKEGLPDRLRTSGILAKGPTEAEYDYQAADLDGVSFSEAEGGANLPIKYQRNKTFAGRDPISGELYQRRNDPNGYGARGNEKLGAAYVNTEQGPSPEVMDGTIPLVMEHLQNGGTFEDMDFALNDEVKENSIEAVKQIASNQVIANKLRALPDEEPNLSESDNESLTLEDVTADAAFLESATTVAGYYKGDLRVGGADVDQEDVTPEYIAEKGIEEMAAVYASMWKMGEIILAVERGTMPPEVQAAYLQMAQTYEKFTPWSMDVLQGTLTGAVSDIPIYAGMARTGKGALISAGKQKAFKLMIQKLMQSTAGKVAVGTAPVMVAGGAEGFGIGSFGERMDQKLSGENDWQKVFSEGTNEALAGVVFATPFGMLFNNGPGREFVKNVGRRVADGMGSSPTPWNKQGGWVGQAPNSYNGRPQSMDMGVPMADSAGGEYYSPLREAITDGSMLVDKPTKPENILRQLRGRVKKGKIRGYEVQEAQFETFLQGKIDAGEMVTRVEMDDYLWANRPRVHSLISTSTDFKGPGSASYSTNKNPASLRKSGAISVIKENFFDTEVVTNAEGQHAWRIKNLKTGEEHVTTNPGVLDTAVREMMADMSDVDLVSMVRTHDRNQLMAPPRWGKPIGDRGTPTIVQSEGGNANNYQEIRLFIPYNGVKNQSDVALARFGKPYDQLTDVEKGRVANIQEYANTPENAFMDEQHYPLEHNRLVHIRTQELYQPQHGGERVLAVNEFQSDMHQGLKKANKETEGGTFIVENADGTEKFMPSKQATEGWVQMTLHRTMQVAQEQGYNKVAIPVDEDMIAKIQLWKEESDKYAGVTNFYKSMKSIIGNDKRLQDTWGITDIKMDHVAAAPDGQYVPEQMLVITFDPPAGKKPIYGIAAVSGAEGATMMDQEENK